MALRSAFRHSSTDCGNCLCLASRLSPLTFYLGSLDFHWENRDQHVLSLNKLVINSWRCFDERFLSWHPNFKLSCLVAAAVYVFNRNSPHKTLFTQNRLNTRRSSGEHQLHTRDSLKAMHSCVSISTISTDEFGTIVTQCRQWIRAFTNPTV